MRYKQTFGFVLVFWGVFLLGAIFARPYVNRIFFDPSTRASTITADQTRIERAKTADDLPEIKIASKEFGVLIPKINVNAPIKANVDGQTPKRYFKELKTAVGHLKGSALPDDSGNMVLFGHSSDIPGATSQYPEVFLFLDKLDKGDLITIFYQNNVYNYAVTTRKTVAADDLSVIADDSQNQLTLITCWPPGTNVYRMVVKAQKK